MDVTGRLAAVELLPAWTLPCSADLPWCDDDAPPRAGDANPSPIRPSAPRAEPRAPPREPRPRDRWGENGGGATRRRLPGELCSMSDPRCASCIKGPSKAVEMPCSVASEHLCPDVVGPCPAAATAGTEAAADRRDRRGGDCGRPPVAAPPGVSAALSAAKASADVVSTDRLSDSARALSSTSWFARRATSAICGRVAESTPQRATP